MSSLPATEQAEPCYAGLDTWHDEAILEALLAGQQQALSSVAAAIPHLARAADMAAGRLSRGGRLVYIAAGSPALISLGDALELPQTYGIPRDRFVLVFAGGEAITRSLTGGEEDDTEAARRHVAEAEVGRGDCAVAISASGSTPYTVAGLAAAAQAGAGTVAIAGNAGAPLFQSAQVKVLLATGPEVIAGSTRMGAGTAQKAALNMLSTLIGVRLGHVYDGLMINLRADNAKLRARAARMVMQICKVAPAIAEAALAQSAGAVKPAVLIAAGATPRQADDLLAEARGNLRAAQAALQAASATRK